MIHIEIGFYKRTNPNVVQTKIKSWVRMNHRWFILHDFILNDWITGKINKNSKNSKLFLCTDKSPVCKDMFIYFLDPSWSNFLKQSHFVLITIRTQDLIFDWITFDPIVHKKQFQCELTGESVVYK